MKVTWMLLVLLFIVDLAFAQSAKSKIRYKKGKRIDFESLLVEGEGKKPEMSVVTGNIGEKDNGLLKYREPFNDFMANDAGEVIR